MFGLLAAILEALLGEVFEEGLERVSQIVITVVYVLAEVGAIAGIFGLIFNGTVARVLFGLAALFLPLDFIINHPERD